jgi:hypothetical protein
MSELFYGHCHSLRPLSELSGVQVMAAGQGFYDAGAGWGEQPSNYSTTWPAHPGTDQWGFPLVNPQNYSGGGGMPTGVPIYATGSVPVAAPIAMPAFPPPSPGAPFDARNYIPPDPSAAPFDVRNYVPPGAAPMQSTYEPRTSESAFDNSMLLHGGPVTSPVVPPTYLLSPQLTNSRSGETGSYTSYTQSPSGLSRSASARPKERETWLYDRPGTWRPRFQMPRSGMGSFVPNFTRVKSFPAGASYDFSACSV